MDDVAAIDTVLIEHELTMPFAIAGGGMDSARAVITRVELMDGTVGLGESAPFPAVSGETVATTSAIAFEPSNAPWRRSESSAKAHVATK